MRFFVAFVALLGLAAGKTLKLKGDVEHGYCNGAGGLGMLTINTLTAEPYPPIVVETGASYTLSAMATLNQEVPVGAKLALEIVKKGIVDITLPCLEIDGHHLGSCEYDGDMLLAEFASLLCPAYVPDGQSCQLPLGTGSYGGDPPITIDIPEIPDIIGNLLSSGTYHVKVTQKAADDSELECIYADIELA